MAKFLHDDVIDAALAVLQGGDRQTICTGQPTTYTQATEPKSGTGFVLGEVVGGPAFTGPANGDTSGRKVTVDQKTGVVIDESARSGTEGYQADHIAIAIDTGTKLLAVTTFAAQDVTAGNTATINAFKLEIQDPA